MTPEATFTPTATGPATSIQLDGLSSESSSGYGRLLGLLGLTVPGAGVLLHQRRR